MNAKEAENLLKKINSEWIVLEKEGVLQLERTFKFKNFANAIQFVNKTAEIAESEGHHPNLYVFGWNKVKVELYTHAIKGLHENDFIIAAKIDEITS